MLLLDSCSTAKIQHISPQTWPWIHWEVHLFLVDSATGKCNKITDSAHLQEYGLSLEMMGKLWKTRDNQGKLTSFDHILIMKIYWSIAKPIESSAAWRLAFTSPSSRRTWLCFGVRMFTKNDDMKNGKKPSWTIQYHELANLRTRHEKVAKFRDDDLRSRNIEPLGQSSPIAIARLWRSIAILPGPICWLFKVSEKLDFNTFQKIWLGRISYESFLQ